MGPDGQTHVQTHSYDPSHDPPPDTRTDYTNDSPTPITRPNPTPTGQMKDKPTPIPPRSELRNAPPVSSPLAASAPISAATTQPGPRPSSNQPLSPSQALSSNPPLSKIESDPVPTSPSHFNFSRPKTVQPTPATDSTGHHGKLDGIKSAAIGIRGAGDALRGTINSAAAKVMHDEEDYARQKAIQEQGLRNMERGGYTVDSSGAHRVRRRSGSQGLRTGPNGRPMGTVDENVVNL